MPKNLLLIFFKNICLEKMKDKKLQTLNNKGTNTAIGSLIKLPDRLGTFFVFLHVSFSILPRVKFGGECNPLFLIFRSRLKNPDASRGSNYETGPLYIGFSAADTETTNKTRIYGCGRGEGRREVENTEESLGVSHKVLGSSLALSPGRGH